VNFPYSTALFSPYVLEGRIFARYLLTNRPNAKLGVFYQNDDAGKDYVRGLKEGLGDQAAKMIVKELTYEVQDPTVDSQIITLKASGADTLYIEATQRAGSQAIRKMAELGWKPLTYVASVMSSIETVLKPAGLENAIGLMTATAFKRPDDPRWKDEHDIQEYGAFLKQWYPAGNFADSSNIIGYITAYVTTRILEQCGDDLTRENVIRQATNLTNLKAPLLLPGVTITTTPQSYSPIRQMQLARFNGESWVLEGDIISSGEPER
jgi:ABC-type branched-subunit amino acid transport system substrate-binding protein